MCVFHIFLKALLVSSVVERIGTNAFADTWRLCVKISICIWNYYNCIDESVFDWLTYTCLNLNFQLLPLAWFSLSWHENTYAHVYICACKQRQAEKHTHMHIHTQRYMYTIILLHGLLLVQTCVAAYVSKLCCEVHKPPHTHMLWVLGINHSLPTPARPTQILILLIMSLLMRVAIPTRPACVYNATCLTSMCVQSEKPTRMLLIYNSSPVAPCKYFFPPILPH